MLAPVACLQEGTRPSRIFGPSVRVIKMTSRWFDIYYKLQTGQGRSSRRCWGVLTFGNQGSIWQRGLAMRL